MAFKMKGFSGFKDTGDHKHPHEKKIGNKPGAEMTELNSSARMRELAALDTGVEYETSEGNLEWQRRKDLNEARNKYSKSLGAPTGDDVAASEKRRKAEESSALPKRDPKVKEAKQNLKDVKEGVRSDAKAARIATREANKATKEADRVSSIAAKAKKKTDKVATKAQKKTDRVTGVAKDNRVSSRAAGKTARNMAQTKRVVDRKKKKNDKITIKQQNARDKALDRVKALESKRQP